MSSERNPEDDEVYCTNCGEIISANVKFCPECGAEQQVAPESEGPSPEEPTTDSSDSDEPSTVDKLAKYTSWGVGGLFALSGLAGLVQSPATGIIILLMGLFVLPPIRSRLENQINYKFARWMVVGIFLIGMVVAGAVAPDTDNGGGGGVEANDGGTGAAAEFAVRISYSGSWQGALSVTGGGSSQSESISGSGTETIEITGDVDIISVNAQKQDDSSEEITVQILHNGEVVSEASTSSEYGVAQTSQSFM